MQLVGLRGLTSPINFLRSLLAVPCLSTTFCNVEQSPHTLAYGWYTPTKAEVK